MVHIIQQFMWGYQHYFRVSLERLGRSLFEVVGVDLEPVALLVGARRPDSDNRNAVCVEPEYGECSAKLFDGLLEDVERTIERHTLQDVFYSDDRSMRDKPERICRDSVRIAVVQALKAYDSAKQVLSFCGTAAPVGEFYVVPVMQVPSKISKAFPSLLNPIGNDVVGGHQGFIQAAMSELLSDATSDLQRDEPGRDLCEHMRSAREIVRAAAETFMMSLGMALGNFVWSGVFEQFNGISSLLYEGTQGRGTILLAKPDNRHLNWKLTLEKPVPMLETRWARKMLQMATNGVPLVADGNQIYGLGNVSDDHQASSEDIFEIDVLEQYVWQIRCGDDVLLRSTYGEPKCPQKPVERELFLDNFSRLFHLATEEDAERIWKLFEVAETQEHGSMIVVAEDAAEEAARLAHQGTPVRPTLMTKDLLQQVSNIDGTIILDPSGNCHAIGVILDGPANEKCTPSRGARFNSGIRYVEASETPRLAIVVSDDRTVDIIPLLRPRISRATLNAAIDALEKARLVDYHQHRNWLEEHRFYLNGRECERVNAALDHIESLAHESGQLYIITKRFTPNSEMNDSYFYDS